MSINVCAICDEQLRELAALCLAAERHCAFVMQAAGRMT
jgi:hypothetical protein